MKFSARMTRNIICLRPGGKVFAANTCHRITQGLPVPFTATVFIKSCKPDLSPTWQGLRLYKLLLNLPLDTVTFNKVRPNFVSVA
jgi:hypothetical protein